MKKIILWSVISVLIIGIAVAAFLWLRKPQIITLSDGVKLTFVGVTYGKHHVAPKIKVAGGRARDGGAPIDSTNDTVVVWIEAEHKPNQYPNYQLMVYDKANTACVSSWARTQSQIKNGVEIQGFMLDAFPRRDSKIYLHIMSYGQRGQQTAKGQFVVSNPARGSFDKWTPEPLPDTQSDGDLDVTLTRLMYGIIPSFNGANDKMKNDPMNKSVLAAFSTEQKGVVVTNWQPVEIETSDATGNHVRNNRLISDTRERREVRGHFINGDCGLTNRRGNCAWKCRARPASTMMKCESVTNIPIRRAGQPAGNSKYVELRICSNSRPA